MILLTGGSGQLGRELCKLDDFYAPTRDQLDITDPRRVYQVLAESEPDLIVHAAAYTNTLGADRDEAQMVPSSLHASCPIIYISTEAVVHPYSFYILSKLQGEMEVARHKHGYTTIRTSFRETPFEYRHAFTDMWTIGDYTPRIAQLIVDLIKEHPVQNQSVWLGTDTKTVYQLAVRSNPEVRPILRSEISPYLPSLEELLDL
jgi:hypothetical protein